MKLEIDLDMEAIGEDDTILVKDELGEHPDREYVPKSMYDEARKDQLTLYALQQAGVDNWDGYGDAMDILDEWENEQ